MSVPGVGEQRPARGSRELRLAGEIHILLVLALTALCGVLAGIASAPVARVTSGLILGLVLPGYALSALVFGRRRLSSAELLLCTLGASLAVSALGGLLLHVLPGHMGRAPWAILLSLVTVLAALAAVLWPHEGAALAGESAAANPGRARPTAGVSRTLLNLALGTLALALTIAAVAVARHAADRGPGFSELSALALSSGREPRMMIRVTSHEHRAISLRLTLSEDGHRLSTTYRTLLPGEEWRLVTRRVRRRTHRVVVRLYRKRGAAAFLHTVFYPPRTATRGTVRGAARAQVVR